MILRFVTGTPLKHTLRCFFVDDPAVCVPACLSVPPSLSVCLSPPTPLLRLLFIMCVAAILSASPQVLSAQDKRPTEAEILTAVEEGDKTAGVFGNLF